MFCVKLANSMTERAMLGRRMKTCFSLMHHYCHRMYTTYTHHLALNQSEQECKQAQGRSHTRVVYKRANQGLEDDQLQSCRNGSRVSCGVSRCLVPQYSCWYAPSVCSFCLSIKFKVTDISHEIALCKPLCDL